MYAECTLICIRPIDLNSCGSRDRWSCWHAIVYTGLCQFVRVTIAKTWVSIWDKLASFSACRSHRVKGTVAYSSCITVLLFWLFSLQVDGNTGRSITYAELRCNVIRCAAALCGLGVKRGDRVCILLTNCVEYPIIMMGIMQLGAICVPVNFMYTKCRWLYFEWATWLTDYWVLCVSL